MMIRDPNEIVYKHTTSDSFFDDYAASGGSFAACLASFTDILQRIRQHFHLPYTGYHQEKPDHGEPLHLLQIQ